MKGFEVYRRKKYAALLSFLTVLWYVAMFAAALWCCGFFHWFCGWSLMRTAASGVGLAVLLAGAVVRRRFGVFLTLFEVSLILFFVLVDFRGAFPEDNWTVECGRVARIREFSGNMVTISDIRDFRYRTPEDFDVFYRTGTFDISKLDSLDLIQSHWDGLCAVSHTLFSFNFSDGRKLVLSFEPRVPAGMRGGQFFPGIYKRYGLFIVLSTPEDIIDLRTKYRKETVFRYRMTLAPEVVRKIFISTVRRAMVLEKHPEFYHTVSANCTTAFVPLIQTAEPGFPGGIRLIFNGYFDRLLFETGYLAKGDGESFRALKLRSLIQ